MYARAYSPRGQGKPLPRKGSILKPFKPSSPKNQSNPLKRNKRASRFTQDFKPCLENLKPIKPKSKTESTTGSEMNKRDHKMMMKSNDHVVFSVDSRGVAGQMDLTASQELVKRHADAMAARSDAERMRLGAVLNAAAIPDECGPDIAPAPARGGFVLQRLVELVPNGADGFVAARTGFGHRSAIRTADIFDRMQAQALRAKRPMALTPGQVAMARRYRTLVEILNADGCKLSSLEGFSGSADGGNWMDRRLELSSELTRLRRRIGGQDALMVRRIRPSKRACLDAGEDPRCKFSNLDIIERVCVDDFSIGDVLRHYRWQADGRNKKAVLEALRAALVRMEGY